MAYAEPIMGLKASNTMPAAPVTTPMTATARPKIPCHMSSDRMRIPAAVRIPAQDTALVAAIRASAALARPARSASVAAATYASLNTTSPPWSDCGLLPRARAMISEAIPNRPPIAAMLLFRPFSATATALNTTRAGTPRPTKHTNSVRYSSLLAAMYSSTSAPDAGGTGAAKTRTTGTTTITTYTSAATAPAVYKPFHLSLIHISEP